MISPAIVSRYANALADVVMSPTSGLQPQEAIAQLRAFGAAYKGSRDLRLVLASPAVSTARKQAVIKDIAQSLGLSKIIRNFILVLSNHRRESAFPQIVEGFEAAMDTRLGFVRAEVRSATELTQQQKDELSRELGQIAGAK